MGGSVTSAGEKTNVCFKTLAKRPLVKPVTAHVVGLY
jgi:hypothetical protein